MKKHLFSILLIITLKSMAQIQPPPLPVCYPNPTNTYSSNIICNTYTYNISTNPAAPINCIPQGRKNIHFNWFGQSTEKINTSCKPNLTISNPTYQANNAAVLPLINISETMRPADGWELLDRNLGLDDNDINISNVSIQSNDLYFCLYNKRLGIIRFFYAIADLYCEPTLFNGSEIKLTVVGGNTVNNTVQSIAPSILDLAGILKPLDMKYEAGYTFDRLEGLLRSSYNWFYADFPVVYDPCVCLYSSKLKFEVVTLSTANVNLSGSITGNILQQLPTGGGISNQGEANNKYSLGNLNKAGQKVLKAYNDNKGFEKTTFDQIDAIYKNDLIRKNDSKNNLLTFINSMKSNNFVKGALNAVPFGMAAISIFDFFTTGGKANSSSTTPSQDPLKFSFDASIQMTGTIGTPVFRRNIIMHTPGSNLTAQNADLATKQCFYNAPLGVFNLITTPVFAKKTQNISSYSEDILCEDEGGNTYTVTSNGSENNLRYILKSPIKYVINPYSDLLLEDAQIALIFEGDSLEYFTMKNGITNIGNTGLIPEGKNESNKKFKFRTEYSNVICLNKLGIAIYSQTNYNPCSGYEYTSYDPGSPVAVKVVCTFKNRIAPTANQNSIYIATYPIKVENDNIINYNPSVCDASFFSASSKTDLTTFCNSITYLDNRAISKTSISEDENNVDESINKNNYNYFLNLTPNPTSGNTLLTIESFEQENTDIYITDVYGKTLAYVVKGQILEIGKSEIDINLTGLQKGLYILHIVSNELHQQVKLIKE